jgi:hypothetical protein
VFVNGLLKTCSPLLGEIILEDSHCDRNPAKSLKTNKVDGPLVDQKLLLRERFGKFELMLIELLPEKEKRRCKAFGRNNTRVRGVS